MIWRQKNYSFSEKEKKRIDRSVFGAALKFDGRSERGFLGVSAAEMKVQKRNLVEGRLE